MSERLYYTNAYQTEFQARVTAVSIVNGQPAVILDQSCFYPTSGGQPYDTGMLHGKRVVEVLVNAQGEVVHLLAEPLPEETVGELIHGVIDWPRRYDHMQQHAGQHLLSQLFYQQFGFETVSVHFGATDATLDLDTPEVTPAQIQAVEDAAMQLVYATLPIKAYFVSDNDLPTIPLRRPPKVSGTIRIVEIEGFDYSACGGTHCRSTGEIGPIKLTRLERRRSQVRITFLCGKRAWQDYQVKHTLITSAANLFGNEVGQVPALIQRNLGQLKEAEQQIEAYQEALLAAEATQLLTTATIIHSYRLLTRLFTDRDITTVKRLAAQLQQQQGVVCLFGVLQAEKVTLLFARSADVAVHMGNLLRDALQTGGGKGGGRADFAQGGGIAAAQGESLLTLSTTWLVSLLLPTSRVEQPDNG